MLKEDWKFIKDFAATGNFVQDFIGDIMREKELTPTARTEIAKKEIQKCILNSATEEGVKSCITVNIEDLARVFVGPGKKPEAEEIYKKLLEKAKGHISDTWGKFIL